MGASRGGSGERQKRSLRRRTSEGRWMRAGSSPTLSRQAPDQRSPGRFRIPGTRPSRGRSSMRSRGLAFLIVAGLLGALYAVLSLQGGGGSRSHEPARPAKVATEAPAPSEPTAPEAPEAATPGRERVAEPASLAAEQSP